MQGKRNANVVLVLERLLDPRMPRIGHQVLCPLQLGEGFDSRDQGPVDNFLSLEVNLLLRQGRILIVLLDFGLRGVLHALRADILSALVCPWSNRAVREQ